MKKIHLFFLIIYGFPTLGQQCECPPGFMAKLKFIDAPLEKFSEKYFLCMADPGKVEKNGVNYSARDLAVVFCELNDIVVHQSKGYSATVYVKNDTLFLEKNISGIPSLFVAKKYFRGNNVKIVYTYNSQRQVAKRVEHADFEKLDEETIQVLIESFHVAVNALKTDENSRFIVGEQVNNMLICALNKNKEAEKIIINFEDYLLNPKGKIIPIFGEHFFKLALLNIRALLVELN